MSGSGVQARLGVVIPFANEEETIEEFLGLVTGQLGGMDRVFCIFDLACRDTSLERARRLGASDPRIVVVWAPENRCVVDAYFRGYREALGAGCRWILEMDGGFSHPPGHIPRFIEAMEKGADFAAGSRFSPGGSYSGRFSRHLISRGGTILANLLLGTRMKDMTSGFECFTRRALEEVLSRGVRSRGHFFQTEIRYMLRGWNWVEIPIRYRNPSRSVSRESLFEAFRILWDLHRKAGTERS